jgi:SSS family solute:Na+ symporter
MNSGLLLMLIVLYIGITGYLGFLGFKHTRNAKDYLVAGREIHPVLMALAYGSTFISTSAIVGFGGAAASLGLGLLWLTFFNIFCGIFLAFVVFGKRTRVLGENLHAHTFPELMAKRFDSKTIQIFSGALIFLAMPLYAAAVMIGGARFLEVNLTDIGMNYEMAILIFGLITAAYVFSGGLKGVIYTDAFQGGLMFVGMAVLIFATYKMLGGISVAHSKLAELASLVPPSLAAQGHQGWTAMPKLGSPIWNNLVTTLVLGVGIGVLAQPQLMVRFMTVKSNKELNRAVIAGGIFILFMTGVAFTVGALSNVWFYEHFGKIALAMVVDPATGKAVAEQIIPLFVSKAMPVWFGYVFMLTLLAAAMSTLSGQFHTTGTAVSHDLYGNFIKSDHHQRQPLVIARMGIVVALIVTLFLSITLKDYPLVVASATALFFGLCAATFLPMVIFGLFWRRATKAGALAGMFTGFLASLIWLLFFQIKVSGAVGFCQMFFGVPSLIAESPWAIVDSIIIAFPLSLIVTYVVSLITPQFPKELIANCFPSKK